jgi:biopolymer transport protein ExbD
VKRPSLLRLGIFVILVAVTLYEIPVTWIKTRNFVPLNVPVSLSDGHFRSPDFKVSLDALYFIGFHDSANENPPYTFCDDHIWQIAKWKVFKYGRPVAVNHESRSGLPSAGEFTGQADDSFNAGPGMYSIDLELSNVPECFKSASIRVQVIAPQDKYWKNYIVLCRICLFLGVIGIAMLVQGAWSSIRARSEIPHDPSVPISQSPGYARNFGRRKRRPMPIFHRMPDFGIFCTAAVLPILAVFMIFDRTRTSMGFKVHVTHPNGVYVNVDPRMKPLLVSIDAKGNFFVSDKQVSRGDLSAALKRELSQRAESTVYFEAAGDAYFGDAAFAMNEIKNASGKLVWLTPKTRQEFAARGPTQ